MDNLRVIIKLHLKFLSKTTSSYELTVVALFVTFPLLLSLTQEVTTIQKDNR